MATTLLFRLMRRLPISTLFPYTTLFRSVEQKGCILHRAGNRTQGVLAGRCRHHTEARSEEHTSELQSLTNLVCRLLLEKKKTNLTRVKIFGFCHVGLELLHSTVALVLKH